MNDNERALASGINAAIETAVKSLTGKARCDETTQRILGTIINQKLRGFSNDEDPDKHIRVDINQDPLDQMCMNVEFTPLTPMGTEILCHMDPRLAAPPISTIEFTIKVE